MENWTNNRGMLQRQPRSGGFTLIASLMLMLLLSGLSIGLLMMVNTESRVGNNDLQNNLAYHAAEGGMEQMTSDLANAFQTMQAPSPAVISALSSYMPPPDPVNNVQFTEYTLTAATNPNGTLAATYRQIGSGANQGLFAQIIPVTLTAAAQTYSKDQVRMQRTVEIALIPVFQFGVFSESDLGFYASPNLDFAGRVHTNGNLFLGVSNSASIAFHDKVTAFGDVVRQQLPNGLPSATNNNNGNVNILTASGGCDILPNAFGANPGPKCRSLALTEGSVQAGPGSTANPSWPTISGSTYTAWLANAATGVKKLSLPFVGGGAQAFEIIRRRPNAAELPTSAVGQSRLYNQAQIRVMLSDTPAENHPDGSAVDAQDIRLVSQLPPALLAAGLYQTQGPPPIDKQLGVNMGGNVYYFGEATQNTLYEPAGGGLVTPSYYHPPNNVTPYPVNFPAATAFAGNNPEWPIIDGYLRVEYETPAGAWVPVTNEWLNLGFSRGMLSPKTPGSNPVNPNAVLIFQQIADRDGNGAVNGTELANPVNANSQYYWYPINFYDAREGEIRDAFNGGSCTVNGVMNAVELDVNNLNRWINGVIGVTGANKINTVQNNGYILYFSDRRGMQMNTPGGAVALNGEYGFEDTINSSTAAGTPDGVLEPKPATTPSPEDVNGSGFLENYGAYNVGDGFGINTHNAPYDPYSNRIASCLAVGRKNRVTGARHVLKLVDGSLGNVPVAPTVPPGGFTVASENPVYVQGDYNSSAADPTWTNPAAAEPAHSSAAIIADAVTMLSNNWDDRRSFINASAGPAGNRTAVTSFYRVAVAAGKNINFPSPAFSGGVNYGFGTDGGVHNFLRFLEDWNPGPQQTLNYKGSLVSLYYSTYATGVFKCCNYVVYLPPLRNYSFDPLFAQPQNLPPGTPLFRDVDNLSYRQDFTPY